MVVNFAFVDREAVRGRHELAPFLQEVDETLHGEVVSAAGGRILFQFRQLIGQ